MKALTVLCNVLLACFTCFVVVTDGVPTEFVYVVFSLLLVVIPVFTVWALVRRPPAGEAHSNVRLVTAVCNIVLLGLICWAFIDQYPHPSDPGFVPFVALAVLTPILSVITLLRGRRIKRIETVRVG